MFPVPLLPCLSVFAEGLAGEFAEQVYRMVSRGYIIGIKELHKLRHREVADFEDAVHAFTLNFLVGAFDFINLDVDLFFERGREDAKMKQFIQRYHAERYDVEDKNAQQDVLLPLSPKFLNAHRILEFNPLFQKVKREENYEL